MGNAIGLIIMVEIKIREWMLEFPLYMDKAKLDSCCNYIETWMEIAETRNLVKTKSAIVFAGLMLVLDNFTSIDIYDAVCPKEMFEIELLGCQYKLEGPIFRKEFYLEYAKVIESIYNDITIRFPNKDIKEKDLLYLMYYAYETIDKWNRHKKY